MSGKQFSLDSRLDLFLGMETNFGDRPNSEPGTTLPMVEDSNESEDNDCLGQKLRVDYSSFYCLLSNNIFYVLFTVIQD